MGADGLITGADGHRRCWWPGADPLYVAYHDGEWGRPVGDDTRLFEKMCLEGFQAGLSWLTILRKRETFREAFHGFEVEKVAAMGDSDVARLLENTGIVRHRGKITAAIGNARLVPAIATEHGSLAAYLWSFEPPAAERPAVCDYATLSALGKTAASQRLSRDLRRRGFRFVGATTMYALMQAMGMVNDHVEGCWCRAEVEAARAAFVRPAQAR